MSRLAYCRECDQKVWLRADGWCVNGHPPSEISRVYVAAKDPQRPGLKRPDTGLVVVVAVSLGLLLLVCGALGIGAAVTSANGFTAAQEDACYGNEREVLTDVYVLRASRPEWQATTWGQTTRDLISEGVMLVVPQCPSGGRYSLGTSEAGNTIVWCSIHGEPRR